MHNLPLSGLHVDQISLAGMYTCTHAIFPIQYQISLYYSRCIFLICILGFQLMRVLLCPYVALLGIGPTEDMSINNVSPLIRPIADAWMKMENSSQAQSALVETSLVTAMVRID